MARPQETDKTNGSGTDGPVGVLRSAASALVSRFDFARRAGVTFGGKRDVYNALGYPAALEVQDYRERYQRGGVAKRLVESFPKATWSRDVRVVDDPDPGEETEFETAVVDLFSRLDAWRRLQRADRLSRLGHYGVLLIGAAGDLEEELPQTLAPDDVLYLTPLAEDRATIHAFELDPRSPRFGLPVTYRVVLGSPSGTVGSAVNTLTRITHWTRVVHVVEDTEEDEVFGEPALRAVWNYLEDLDKLVGGGSEAAWRRMDPGLHFDIDPEAQLSDDEVQAMRDQVDEFVHGLSRVVSTTGGDLTPLTASVAGFGSNVDTVLKLISATTGIPVRILTGSERAELASAQDRTNFADRIAERREDFATPVIRQLVDRLVDRGALPGPRDEQYDVVWPDIDALGEDEKAGVADRIAAANQKQFQAEGTIVVTAEEIRDRVFGLGPLKEVVDENEVEIELPSDEEDEEELAELRGAVEFVDRDPRRPDRQAVLMAAAENLPPIEGAFKTAREDAVTFLDATELDDAIRSRDARRAERAVDTAADRLEANLRDRLPEAILDTMASGGEEAAKLARRRDSFFRSAQLEVEFDRANPRAVEAAQQRAAELVVEVGPATREAIRELVVAGILEGIAPRELARRVRLALGLTSRGARAVVNLEVALRAAEPGTLVVRFPEAPTVRTIPGFRVRIPAGGLTEAEIERRIAQYARMQLNLRARTIARTETMRAANAGARELWRQAIDRRQLPGDVRRVWITARDAAVRDAHRVMEGVTVGVDEPFNVPDGTTEPGQAPNCRCAQGLVRPEVTQ